MRQKVVLSLVLILLSANAMGFPGGNLLGDKKGKAAVIKLSGPIKPSAGGFSSSGISPSYVRDKIDKAKKDNVDAMVFEINSGGGAVVASKEVKRAIESIDVPTVCRFRDIAASGAYYASLGCDKIVADSSTVTGSIGVKASYLEYSGLLKKLGVEYVNITAGGLKDMGSPYHNLSKEERKVLEAQVKSIQQRFIHEVRVERNLSQDDVEKIKTGRVFLGEEAKRMGLVDKLGGRQTAFNLAENMTDQELKFDVIENKPDFSLLSLLSSVINIDFNLGRKTSILKASY